MASEKENDPSSLSKRAQRTPIDLDYINNYSSWPAVENPYNEKDNPTGIINFGTAVSGLMDDIWEERLKRVANFKPNSNHFRYYQFWGPDNIRKNLATFMNAFFKPRLPISFDKLFMLNGAMVSLDILSFMLADERDVFLCPVPAYSSYFHAGVERWNIEVVSVPMSQEKENNEIFTLKIETLERVYREQSELGKNVRAVIYNNPNNPLGTVWDRETTEEVMRFCQRNKIHLIADEMYCMSVFDKGTRFHSVLEIHTDELLDSSRMHLIWGFSKDLCLTSFRTGVIHTENEELQMRLKSTAQFQAVPLPLMEILTNIISDVEWFQNVFVPINHERLRVNHEKASSFMKSLDIPITDTKAGFFFLADFRKILKSTSRESCKGFIRKLYENGVYLTPGWEMRGDDGWFRLVFTPYSGSGLSEGFRRLRLAIDQWRKQDLKS